MYMRENMYVMYYVPRQRETSVYCMTATSIFPMLLFTTLLKHVCYMKLCVLNSCTTIAYIHMYIDRLEQVSCK